MDDERVPSKLEAAIERLNQDPYLLAAITAIPYVGGSITQVLTGIGQQIVQERNARLFEQLSEHLRTVDEEALRRNYFETRAHRAAHRITGGLTRGASALRLLAHSAVLPAILLRDPSAAARLLRHSAVRRGVGSPAHRAFLAPPSPMAPRRKGGDAQGGQPPLRGGAGLPRLGDDRRDLLDHRRTVRWRRRGCSNKPFATIHCFWA